jgi:two-component system, NarL family, nitrate/nitrite response regulator NarL
MQPAQVYIVERFQLLREVLRNALAGPEFSVSGEAETLADILDFDVSDAPDLILLDHSASDTLPVDDLRSLRQRFAKLKIVILGKDLSSASLKQCFDAEVDGYLLKDVSVAGLMQSLRLVLIGEKVFPTSLASLLVDGDLNCRPVKSVDGDAAGLSKRETEILQGLLHGSANKVIAHQLAITESTVKVHLKGILRKIRATNRTQAAIWALNHGMVGATLDAPTARGNRV